MTNVFDEAAKLWPPIKKYKKLLVAFITATVPYVTYLTSGSQGGSEVVAWSLAYVLGLFGVYEAKNGS